MSYFFVSVNNGFQLWIIEHYYTINDNWNGKNIWELWFQRLNCEYFFGFVNKIRFLFGWRRCLKGLQMGRDHFSKDGWSQIEIEK